MRETIFSMIKYEIVYHKELLLFLTLVIEILYVSALLKHFQYNKFIRL